MNTRDGLAIESARPLPREEVATLFGHTPSIVLANACGAVVVAVGSNARAEASALAWTGAVVVLSTFRLWLLARYRKRPAGTDAFWARVFVATSVCAGLLWGGSPFIFGGDAGPTAMLLQTFVVGGLVAGAAGTLACHLPAFVAFSVPALIPLGVELAASGGQQGRLMALMVGVYGLAMTAVARNVNRALYNAFALRLANERLLERQGDVNRILEESNRDLDRRIMERTAELRAYAERQRDAADLGCRALTDDNIEHIACRAATALVRALDVDSVCVFELLPDGKTLACRGAEGTDASTLAVLDAARSPIILPRSDGVCHSPLAAAALADGLVTTDGSDASHFGDDPLVATSGVESFLCAALAGEGAPLGLIFVGFRGRRRFGRDDTSYVRIVANVVAAAVAQRRSETVRRRGQQLEAMGRIASGVAHEINTPMQFIAHSATFVGEALPEMLRVFDAHEKFVDTLAGDAAHGGVVAELQRLREETKMRFLLDTIPRSLERIHLGVSRVAETLRATRKLGTGSSVSKDTDVNDLIRSAAIITNHVTQHVADVELVLGDLPRITAHPGELLQVFQNLIGNAADAIREKYGKASRGKIRLSSDCRDGKVVVLVEDDGCGIPKAHLPRVFEPFYSTKEEKHGSGQGLAIARDIIERGHGGTLSVRSEPGRGTEFRIEVPKDVVDPMSWRSVILARDVTSLIPMAKEIKARRAS